DSYRQKCNALADALQTSFGGLIDLQLPEGGMFLWARCADIDSGQLLEYAIRNRVLFVPGKAFYAESGPSEEFRLSFASPGQQNLVAGAERLFTSYRQMTSSQFTIGEKTCV